MKRRMNQKYAATKVVNALSTNKPSELIGVKVIFKNLESRGIYHKVNTFEIIGTQKVWGYNKEGQYALIDGYRVISITSEDDFGCAASLADLEFITPLN